MSPTHSHTCEASSGGPLVLSLVNKVQSGVTTAPLRHTVHGERCVVGSASSATLTIELPGVELEHCEIIRGPVGTWARGLRGCLRINGQVMNEAWLHPGDQLGMGDLELVVESDDRQMLCASDCLPRFPDPVIAEWSADAPTDSSADFDIPDFEIPVIEAVISEPDFQSVEAAVAEPEFTGFFELPCEPEGIRDEYVSTVEPARTDLPPYGADRTTNEQDQANWLDELYDAVLSHQSGEQVKPDEPPSESVVDEVPVDESFPLASSEPDLDPSSWLAGGQVSMSELIKSVNDPTQLERLPKETAAGVARVFERFETADDSEVCDAAVVEAAETVMADVEPRVELLEQSRASETIPDDEAIEMRVPVMESPAEIPKNESVADVLARMQKSGELAFNTPKVESKPETPFPQKPVPVPPAPVEMSVPSGDDVDDYMKQLMYRLRGDEPVSVPVAIPQPVKTFQTSADRSSQREELNPANPLPASEYVPRGSAPEKTSTLDALRQIANQSVHSAIQTSMRKKNRDNSLLHLGATGVAFFVSTVLFIMSNALFDLAFIIACLAAAGCAACGYLFMRANMASDPIVKNRQAADRAKAKTPEPPSAADRGSRAE